MRLQLECVCGRASRTSTHHTSMHASIFIQSSPLCVGGRLPALRPRPFGGCHACMPHARVCQPGQIPFVEMLQAEPLLTARRRGESSLCTFRLFPIQVYQAWLVAVESYIHSRLLSLVFACSLVSGPEVSVRRCCLYGLLQAAEEVDWPCQALAQACSRARAGRAASAAAPRRELL